MSAWRRTPRAVGIAFVAVCLIAPPARVLAATGAIKGTVTTAAAPGEPVANAVVMVEGPSVPAPAAAPHPRMDQRRDTFVPHVLAVAVGTTVDFPNSDPRLHNVYSLSQAKKFDLGMYGEGETKSVTFDLPGVVEVRCNVHPMMEAYVVVHGNPHVAVTDAQGGYTITSVPPGSYRLRVWHESLAAKETRVVVREGQVQTVNVRLAP